MISFPSRQAHCGFPLATEGSSNFDWELRGLASGNFPGSSPKVSTLWAFWAVCILYLGKHCVCLGDPSHPSWLSPQRSCPLWWLPWHPLAPQCPKLCYSPNSFPWCVYMFVTSPKLWVMWRRQPGLSYLSTLMTRYVAYVLLTSLNKWKNEYQERFSSHSLNILKWRNDLAQ